jgi:hypothetical protein
MSFIRSATNNLPANYKVGVTPWKGEQHEAIIVCMTVSATHSNKYRSIYGGLHLHGAEQCTPSFLEPPKSQVILSAENSWVKDIFPNYRID